ncbi:hypothetical protein GCM10022226_33370 [Sphaerisporangium flaviroseum]|uniref:Uncharacterized protein n=1 Tax=Sphaerisporangium flaviroseum TaxID=509199 RepID=A0ABP7I4L9_9ACTN
MGPGSPTRPWFLAVDGAGFTAPPPAASAPQVTARAPDVIRARPLDHTTKTSPQSIPVAVFKIRAGDRVSSRWARGR